MRVGLWQTRAVPADVPANLTRLAAVLARAREAGVDVLVTPEMLTTGYDIGPEATAALAEPRDGPTARAVARLGEEAGVGVLFGYPERGEDGRLYNAAQLVHGGRALLHHRKVHLFGDLDAERFTAGDAPAAPVRLGGHTVAALICYDVEHREAVDAVARAGASLVLVPTANMVGYEEVSRRMVPEHAARCGLTIGYANYVGREGEQHYTGLSVLAGPGGVVEMAGTDEEVLLVHDVPAPAP